MNKVKSLDFDGFDPNKRLIDAKIYRQKLLEEAKKKQQMKNNNYQTMDYVSTKSTDGKKGKHQKKKKQKQDGHGVTMDEKASFGQCAFNMANILMVRRKTFS